MPKDFIEELENLKRVQDKSRIKGHCVCNKTKTCPCDEYKVYNQCKCANYGMVQKK